MLNKEHWEQIIADYKIAYNCLVCPKHTHSWYRQEDKGLYYLLKAFLAAKEEPEKDHLWYARILWQMGQPYRFNKHEHERFYKFIEPAIEEYKHIEKTERFEKEINGAFREYSRLKAKLDFIKYEGDETYKRFMSLIENSELLDENDISFHDGKVLSFYHDNENATLIFKYYDNIVTLGFEGIINVEIYYDEDNYIQDVVCYPAYMNDTRTKVFDIETHKIICEKIKVVSVEKTQ